MTVTMCDKNMKIIYADILILRVIFFLLHLWNEHLFMKLPSLINKLNIFFFYFNFS